MKGRVVFVWVFVAQALIIAEAAAQQFTMLGTAGMADSLTCIGVSHRDPNFVLVGTNDGRILRTVDGGANWQVVTVAIRRDLYYGVERQEDPDTEYGLGLPGKSPYLQSWLRRQGLHTAGVNWQQLLVGVGDRPVSINWIEVDWHDENRVYVATADGLYLSTNKGRNFQRLWQGVTGPNERYVTTVATDPAERNRILLGSAGGLFVSTDGGETFVREFNYYIFGSYVRAIYFDPEYAGLVHMALSGAAMASPDSGRNWITTYWDLWEPRSSVQWISLGPNNVRAMGTRDGLFASDQGGEMGTWFRRGGQFIGREVTHVMVTQNAQLWLALTDQAVWRTADAGVNWTKIKQTGGGETPIWLDGFNRDPNQLWLLTSRHVYRSGAPPSLAEADPEQRDARFLRVPSLSDFWEEVVKHKHVYFDDVQRYRERAPWAALVPGVTAGATFIDALDTATIRVYPHLHLPFTYYSSLPDRAWAFEVFLSWDFSRFIFDKRELPNFGRIERNLREIRDDLTDRVIRLYGEYRAVAMRLAYNPPSDAVAREGQLVRLQEITSFFDSISDGYWSEQQKGEL